MTAIASAVFVEQEEAEDLGVTPGWYIFAGGVMRGDAGSLRPFSSEQDAQAAIAGQLV